MEALVEIVKIGLAGVAQFIGTLSHTPKGGRFKSVAYLGGNKSLFLPSSF